MEDTLNVTVGDGKYTVIQGPDGRLRALRYGDEWRDCCGDGLIYALAAEVAELRANAPMKPVNLVGLLDSAANALDASLTRPDPRAVDLLVQDLRSTAVKLGAPKGRCDCGEPTPSDYGCAECEASVVVCGECKLIVTGCGCGNCPVGEVFQESE